MAEGISTEKLERIESSNFLGHALRSLANIGGGLLAYGLSFSKNDKHIIDAIVRSSISRLTVSLFGDSASQANQATIQAVRNLQAVRAAATTSKPVEIKSSPQDRFGSGAEQSATVTAIGEILSPNFTGAQLGQILCHNRTQQHRVASNGTEAHHFTGRFSIVAGQGHDRPSLTVRGSGVRVPLAPLRKGPLRFSLPGWSEGFSAFRVRSSVISLRPDFVLLLGQNWSTAPPSARGGRPAPPAYCRPHSVRVSVVAGPPRASGAQDRRAAAARPPGRRGSRSR